MDQKAGTSLNPGIAITFRMSRNAHMELMTECGYCSCNISGFVRHAVMKEIAARRKARRKTETVEVLPGQMDIDGGVNAKDHA